MSVSINISKLDASKREIEHAIRIFFNNGDVVVEHLVASSAYQILRDLAKKQNIKSYRDQLMDSVKFDKQKFVTDKLNEAYNFFKHADFDDDKTVVFNPELTEFVIWDSIFVYKSLSQEETGIMVAYRLWFNLKNKDLITDIKFKEVLENLGPYVTIDNKILFLNFGEQLENKRVI